MTRIDAGDAALELKLTTQNNEHLTLPGFRGKQALVVFLYPKDGTPVCTVEACAFRDAYEDFVDAGAAVIGVSGDSAAQRKEFASSHRLPFLLVSDFDGKARRTFGVPKSLGILSVRVTYMIDTEVIVRHVFRSQFAADRHEPEALEVVRGLDT